MLFNLFYPFGGGIVKSQHRALPVLQYEVMIRDGVPHTDILGEAESGFIHQVDDGLVKPFNGGFPGIKSFHILYFSRKEIFSCNVQSFGL